MGDALQRGHLVPEAVRPNLRLPKISLAQYSTSRLKATEILYMLVLILFSEISSVQHKIRNSYIELALLDFDGRNSRPEAWQKLHSRGGRDCPRRPFRLGTGNRHELDSGMRRRDQCRTSRARKARAVHLFGQTLPRRSIGGQVDGDRARRRSTEFLTDQQPAPKADSPVLTEKPERADS
jgi:hypothetical protein